MWSWLKRRQQEVDPPAEMAESFGYKTSWLAVRNTTPLRLVEALKLANVRKSGWSAGLSSGYERSVFVAPPIDGWTLVVCSEFDELKLGQLAARVSAELATEVQAFYTQRVSETHLWARAEHGILVRGYGYSGCSGDLLLDVGDMSDDERAQPRFTPYKKKPIGIPEEELPRDPGEQDVIAIAKRWGFDPTALSGRRISVPYGYVGALPAEWKAKGA